MSEWVSEWEWEIDEGSESESKGGEQERTEEEIKGKKREKLFVNFYLCCVGILYFCLSSQSKPPLWPLLYSAVSLFSRRSPLHVALRLVSLLLEHHLVISTLLKQQIQKIQKFCPVSTFMRDLFFTFGWYMFIVLGNFRLKVQWLWL